MARLPSERYASSSVRCGSGLVANTAAQPDDRIDLDYLPLQQPVEHLGEYARRWLDWPGVWQLPSQ